MGVLEKTIAEAENSQFSGQLQNQIEAARRKLEHLKVRSTKKESLLALERHHTNTKLTTTKI